MDRTGSGAAALLHGAVVRDAQLPAGILQISFRMDCTKRRAIQATHMQIIIFEYLNIDVTVKRSSNQFCSMPGAVPAMSNCACPPSPAAHPVLACRHNLELHLEHSTCTSPCTAALPSYNCSLHLLKLG